MSRKEVIGAPLVIDGRVLSLSQAVRAGDFVFVTGQVPMRDGEPMTDGSIEDQTRACLESLQEDFPGFNAVYSEYFPNEPPTRSALVSEFLIDILVEIECVAYKPR
jgi:enamine deaminase RidA (YjgF/YER057c/UK114 family)